MEEIIALPTTSPSPSTSTRTSLRADGTSPQVAAEQRAATLAAAKRKYARGGGDSLRRLKRFARVRDKKLRADLLDTEAGFYEAAASAARAEVLLPEDRGFLEAESALEKTYHFSQKALVKAADQRTVAKRLTLRFPQMGDYCIDFSRNGRYLALAGASGHLGLVDCLRNAQQCEVHVGERVRDIKVLQDASMFAVAQRKNVFIYDDGGMEVHRLRSHVQPWRLEYLPYHYLLASVGKGGFLKYQDVSTGEMVAEIKTKKGSCDCMKQNPWNAILCLGHMNGTVSMWAPSMHKPVVNMLCHTGPVRTLSVDRGGRHMVTSGLDGKLSIWDVRTYKRLHSYHVPHPPMSTDISQTGLLSVACGHELFVWKDALRNKAQAPYMKHTVPGKQILCTRFRPFEDVLAISYKEGVETLIVPGAGAANFDAFEANPFQSLKQRRENQVHALLEKIQPELISLDPTSVGKVDRSKPEEVELERKEKRAEAEVVERKGQKKEKKKMRGKNKIGRRIKKKHRNIISAEREALKKKFMEEKSADGKEKQEEGSASKPFNALDRFK